MSHPNVRETVPGPLGTELPRPEEFDPISIAFDIQCLSVFYQDKRAITDINIQIPKNRVTAIIGPSGCGKSTLLRTMNRMNDLIIGVKTEGTVTYNGVNLYAKGIDPSRVRSQIGMVFQKPNPFPTKSIYENVAYGPKTHRMKDVKDKVETALRKSALWDVVKDRLKESPMKLSGGEQQRLCLARALAVEPPVILMDEPCSALDPMATLKIEDLMRKLAIDTTVVVVTHNMQQAARVSDYTAFLLQVDSAGEMAAGFPGRLIEFARTRDIFVDPKDKRTAGFITGKFG